MFHSDVLLTVNLIIVWLIDVRLVCMQTFHLIGALDFYVRTCLMEG